MSETSIHDGPRLPTVYFIDDSATMREVMKIAFRREKIGVVICNDALIALNRIEEAEPDVVITDVIMPKKNGFEVCQFIKEHPRLSKTPVVLLSGVVNREVTEEALRVKADELIRKPFQPQDLIARVKQLIALKHPPEPALPPAVASDRNHPRAMLSDIFESAANYVRRPGNGPMTATHAPVVTATPGPLSVSRSGLRASNADGSRTRLELLRLESLVKKLESELAAERDYSRALEAHIRTLQENE